MTNQTISRPAIEVEDNEIVVGKVLAVTKIRTSRLGCLNIGVLVQDLDDSESNNWWVHYIKEGNPAPTKGDYVRIVTGNSREYMTVFSKEDTEF